MIRSAAALPAASLSVASRLNRAENASVSTLLLVGVYLVHR